MTKIRAWQGVRMRAIAIGADPDAPPREVTVPASWDDTAAAALAALAPGAGPVALAVQAEAWFRPVADRARRGGLSETLLTELHALLRDRRGMADPASLASGDVPRFVLNLPAFLDEAGGFDVPGFAAAIRAGTIALALARPEADAIEVGFADLDGLLAALGLDYASSSAREVAAGLAALIRGEADSVSGLLAERFGPVHSAGHGRPAAPEVTPVPGLAAAARAALDRAAAFPSLRHARTTGLSLAGAAEALLGAETAGLAPAFAPVGPHGLTRAARARLAAAHISPEAALVRLLQGEALFPTVAHDAHVAMRGAVSAFLQALPSLPVETPVSATEAQPAGPRFEPLPARHAGTTQRAAIGAHRLFLRTGEYADGRIAEISLSAPRETATVRGLMDGVSAAVSIGLQHGVPLAAYVEAFLLTRFGPAGTVEGDPHVAVATSPLDWMARNLAATHLLRTDLPPAEAEPESPARTPLLPLDLPDTPRARRRNLRVVA